MARPIKGATEEDVFTRARRFYCYTQRPGVCKRVKRQANRRERHRARSKIRHNIDDL